MQQVDTPGTLNGHHTSEFFRPAVMVEGFGKTALVTGATGFIGSTLCVRLVEDGWSVKVLARDTAKLPLGLRGRVEVVTGNLLDKWALFAAVDDVSVIFHCAANVSTWDSRESYFETNVQGVEALINAVLRRNPTLKRLVHVSTVDVYGFPEMACDERCGPVAAGFGYGDSKLAGESVLRQRCEASRIPYVIIRPANVIGPGSQFISRIGDELRSGLMLTVAQGHANAGLVYVDNLIDYMLWASQSPKAIGQCYNVRDDYDVTWKEFIAAFRTAISGRGLVIDLPFWAADAAARLLEGVWRIFLPGREPLLHRLLVRIFGRTCGHSAEKIRTDSGLSSRVRFDEAIRRSVKWFMECRSSA